MTFEGNFEEKINGILQNEQYIAYMAYNTQAEQERLYCRHGLLHALDVARICYVLCLENGLGREFKTVAYAAGLLHDLGRFCEYADPSCDHAVESAKLAKPILDGLPFTAEEKKIIVEAILRHREPNQNGFNGLFYQADKLSRPCFRCKQKVNCKRQPSGILSY